MTYYFIGNFIWDMHKVEQKVQNVYFKEEI